MIYTNTQSSFPDQVVPQEEKMSLDYGMAVGRAIEGEWWASGVGGARYSNNYNIFHRRRLYARGEQSIQKYKDELSINGDLSYLNLDWTPVPVIPKFVDIVVNGMSEKIYDINDLFSIIEINDTNQLLDINAVVKKNKIIKIIDVEDIIDEGNFIEIGQLDLNTDNPFVSAFLFFWGKIKDFSYYYNT